LDISNNVRQVALPFLAILKHDMRPDELLQLTLDFRPPTHKEKELHKAPSYARGAYHSVVDTTYRDVWFEGSVRLADGAQLRWRVLEDIRESRRTKRNARGKTKTKTRHYKRSYVEIVVALPVKHYALARVRPDTQLKTSLHTGEKRNTVRLVRKLKSKSLEPIPMRLLIDAISHVYTSAEPPVRRAG
jgi:hypothetical protein